MNQIGGGEKERFWEREEKEKHLPKKRGKTLLWEEDWKKQ